MPVPSQGHYGSHSFPVVDWFCLFIYLWVFTFPLKDCPGFGNFVITLTCNRKGYAVNETPIYNNNLCMNFLFHLLCMLKGCICHLTCIVLKSIYMAMSFSIKYNFPIPLIRSFHLCRMTLRILKYCFTFNLIL
jgi:hypothetical protein